MFSTLAQHAALRPEQIALHADGHVIAYGALLPEIDKRVALLKQADIEVLGLQLANSADWILWDLAALRAGVVCVPLPAFFTPQQLAHVIRSAGVEACITPTGFAFNQLEQLPSMPPATAKITFTSGTTGTPKGVCLPAPSMIQLAQSLLSAIGAEYGKRHASVMPLPILLENVAGVYTALLAGAKVYIPSPATIGMENPFRPDFSRLSQYIAQHEITSLILTPELLRGLIPAARMNKAAFASLRFIAVGGATVPPALLQAARHAGLPVYEGYGLSECASVVALNTPSADFPGTVGRVLPHVSVAIRGGEVVVGNPAFLGYLGDPPRSPTEPFATGDNGMLRPDGTLSIFGRRKNTIITAQGRNIAPEWVEAELLLQPQIAQAFVYGSDLSFPQALLVPSREQADLAAAIARVNATLPVYAQIARFDVVPPFTVQNGMLTPTGRLRREQISHTYQSLMKAEAHHDPIRQIS